MSTDQGPRDIRKEPPNYRPYRPEGSKSGGLQVFCTVGTTRVIDRTRIVIDRRMKYRPRYRPCRNPSFCGSFLLCMAPAVDAVDNSRTLLGRLASSFCPYSVQLLQFVVVPKAVTSIPPELYTLADYVKK